MNTLICCIGKEENKYIREYIDHYKKLGVTNICLYDNNDINGERFEDVIQEDIDNGYIIYNDWRGKKVCQLAAYEDCYERFSDTYDWILYIDCGDEYLELIYHDNIDDFLSCGYYDNYDVIHLNLMGFTDNDLIYYEDKPLQERFTQPHDFNLCTRYWFPDNYHISSIVRGHLLHNKIEHITFVNPHTPINKELSCCDQFGLSTDVSMPWLPYNYSIAYFKHYSYKTIDEFCDKIKRGYPDQIVGVEEITNAINNFFIVNKVTDEKYYYMKDKLAKFNIIIGEAI